MLGGPHVTLMPDDAQPHADSIVVGYAEDEWPRLLRDFAAGRLRPRYTQSPSLAWPGVRCPTDLLDRGRYLTDNVFEATRGCVHNCEFCVVPAAWGRKPFQKPVEEVVADIRRQRPHGHLHRPQPDRRQGLRRTALRGPDPAAIQWYGLATTLLGDDLELLDLAARSGCRGLLIGLESIEPGEPARHAQGFQRARATARWSSDCTSDGIALQGCFVFGLDDDTPDVFLKTARFAVEARIDLPRFAVVTPFPGTALYNELEAQGRILHPNWELYDGQHVVFQPRPDDREQLQEGIERAWKHAYRWGDHRPPAAASGRPVVVALLANLGYRYYAHHLHRFYNCDAMVAGRPMHPRRSRPRARLMHWLP